MKIAYLLDAFPALSETFVLNEILMLKKMNQEIFIYARYNPNNKIIHKTAKNLTVNYLCDIEESKKNVFFYLKNKVFTLQFIKIIVFLYKYYHRFLKKHGLISYCYTIWFSIVLSKQFEENKIEHVHSHFAGDASFLSMIIYLFTGIPYSFTTHSYDIYLQPKMLYEKHFYAKFAITISNYNKKYLIEKFNIEKDKINVVRCGIDLSCFHQIDCKEREVIRIVSVARLVETKGFLYLIKGCHLFQRKYGNKFICNIVGDGPMLEAIRNLIQKLNLNNVFLLGAKTHDEVIEILDNSDIFILPCVRDKTGRPEGIPVALMEAMAKGMVVVSSDLAGIPELVSEVGILIHQNDEHEVFRALERFYNMSIDDRFSLGRLARQKIEKDFNLVIETKKLIQLFEQ
ncbi:MAG: glycosyltransferase [Candidatus Auribacterota bacterium]|jgi:glycosyltransferase involved in cell wall biosynthesis|nr:glycosyltransferase [Candidatus Auribacterota bacterium]